MKKLLIMIVFSAASSYAQASITDVLSMIDALRANQSTALTITASQGDGTTCIITKFAGTSPHISLKCIPGDGKSQLSQANLSLGTAVQTMFWGYGDVACLLAINPTAAAVVVGTLGSVPASAIAWSCSTNVDVAGVPVSQTAIISGSVVWP
jgi:hypothetical protein